MEYREDLLVTLLDGLSPSDRTAVIESIDRTTDRKRRQIRQSALSEQQRLLLRRTGKHSPQGQQET